jgi:hypothetical protein
LKDSIHKITLLDSQEFESEMPLESEKVAHTVLSSVPNFGIEQSTSTSGLLLSASGGGKMPQTQTYKSIGVEKDSSICVISASTAVATELPTSVLGSKAIKVKHSIQTKR